MARLETIPDDQARASSDGRHDNGGPGIGAYVGTLGLVGLGLAFIEEELLAGMAIGVAAMAFPKLVPRLGTMLRPALKSAVRAGYSLAERTRETVAEMTEQVQDVIAEVRAEHEHEHGADWDATTEQHEHAEPGSATAAEQSAQSDRGKTKRSAKAHAESAETQ